MIGYAIQKGNRVEIYNENGALNLLNSKNCNKNAPKHNKYKNTKQNKGKNVIEQLDISSYFKPNHNPSSDT